MNYRFVSVGVLICFVMLLGKDYFLSDIRDKNLCIKRQFSDSIANTSKFQGYKKAE